MKETWSQIESQWVMDKLSETCNNWNVIAYQKIKYPEYLIVLMPSTSSYEIGKLSEKNMCATIFGNGARVELWISKL